MREDTKAMSNQAAELTAQNVQKPVDGVTVVGEAVRGIPVESAEFLMEITASAPTASQSLRDNQAKSTQVAQALAPLAVQPADLQTISMNVYNLYQQAVPALAGYGGIPQIGPQAGHSAFGLYSAAAANQPEVQFGSYLARKMVRVNVREPARVGEIVDAAVRAGATVGAAFSFKASDETAARRSALEAAAKDARAKAEALAIATGKQLGDPVAISEDIVAANGAYAALRSAVPFAFGAGTPQITGDLEYYARVSARFRFQ